MPDALFLWGAGGSKRRKVTKTSYTDQGEEITEVVWEDEAAPEPAATAGLRHGDAQPSAAEDADGSTALRERQANGNAGGGAASSQPAKKPNSPKKSGKAAGKPSGKAGAKTSGRVRCHAGSAAGLMLSTVKCRPMIFEY